MKKIFKALMCASLAGVISVGTIGAVGCKNEGDPGSGVDLSKREYRNSETQPLRLSIGAVDENFNPLYYTSLNDGTIANLTQVSLITSDSEGKLSFGEDEPTVALDYLETYYAANGHTLATGDGRTVQKYGADGDTSGDINGSTTYEFLIKKGMKFSDGHDLTVMDVLFNLYVYLDPLYSGSNTIYSTKIKGLTAYRTNTPGAPDDLAGDATDTALYVNADNRVTALYKWADGKLPTFDANDKAKAVKLYKEKLESDWNSIATGYVEAYKNYYFDEAWKAFLYEEGAIKDQMVQNENGAWTQVKDESGKYLTQIDPDPANGGAISDIGQEIIAYMQDEVSAAAIAEEIAKNPGMKEEVAKLNLQKKAAIEYIYDANTSQEGIKKILGDGSFYGTVLDEFYKEEVSNKVANQGGKKVDRIEGITVSHTGDAEHNGTFNGKTYTEDHDILKIEVAGIDPKAKWNFGFSVAPMHYYSSTNYEGKDYVAAAMKDYTDGKVYAGTATEFGVEYSNTGFIDDVLTSDSKKGLPVGAGAYKCCTYSYGQSGLTAGTFFYSNTAFFERNIYFETMGAEIENAKIKYVTYAVTDDDKIVDKLLKGEIDYGEPIATAVNKAAVKGMASIDFKTGGYGYVGINPKSVPDITVRRAIMMAFDTQEIIEYYGQDLVDIIYRPISNTSWVWDHVTRPTAKDAYYKKAANAKAIQDYIEKENGWQLVGNTWYDSDGNEVNLTYTFTIAGQSVDHPAYHMFVAAEEVLERAGFSISVETDIRALQKLATGNLEVWAAAWSSSIDPDPYQIYSIYSKASSTKNWNKDGILKDTITYAKEYEIAQKLNNKILAGRQTLDEQLRANIYGRSVGSDLCALDLIMELAVEFPTYQRKDLCVYNGNVLDRSTMTKDPSHNMGPIAELWKLSYFVRPANEEPAE